MRANPSDFFLLPFSFLLAKAEPGDDGNVAGPIDVAQVIEQPGALADHHQQTAPARMVLLVRAQMLSQIRDALREQRDLDLWRAGVAVVDGVPLDDVLLPD